jgi:hypothetical protein
MRRAIVQAVILSLALAGCGIWGSVDSSFSTATLTHEPANDTYALAYNNGSGAATITADGANTGGNNRGVFFPAGQATRQDAETCAHGSLENAGSTVVPNVQRGAALRIRTNGDGSVDAITVTRNIFYGAVWIFNEHIWNTNRSPSYTQLGGVDLRPVFDPSGDGARPAPLPWDICAKTVGSTLSFVAWLDGTPKPAYGDSTHGGSIALPAEYVYPGNYGWYVGHLTAGQSVTFDHLEAKPL